MNIKSLTLLASIAVATFLFVAPTIRDQRLEEQFEGQPFPQRRDPSLNTAHIEPAVGKAEQPPITVEPIELTPVTPPDVLDFPAQVAIDTSAVEQNAPLTPPSTLQLGFPGAVTEVETPNERPEMDGRPVVPDVTADDRDTLEALNASLLTPPVEDTAAPFTPDTLEFPVQEPPSNFDGPVEQEQEPGQAPVQEQVQVQVPQPEAAVTVPGSAAVITDMQPKERNLARIYTGSGSSHPNTQPGQVAWNPYASSGTGSAQPMVLQRPTARPRFDATSRGVEIVGVERMQNDEASAFHLQNTETHQAIDTAETAAPAELAIEPESHSSTSISPWEAANDVFVPTAPESVTVTEPTLDGPFQDPLSEPATEPRLERSLQPAPRPSFQPAIPLAQPAQSTLAATSSDSNHTDHAPEAATQPPTLSDNVVSNESPTPAVMAPSTTPTTSQHNMPGHPGARQAPPTSSQWDQHTPAGDCDAGDCDAGDCDAVPVDACDQMPGCDMDDALGITIGGWFSAGYHSESNDLFNSRPDQLALHQGWLYIERSATESSPIGFRVDAMYGLDADDTQAFGNNPGEYDFQNGFDSGAYGWAFPQAYLELAMGDWNVRAGHFYTLLGYEVVGAPDNFFYSHAITMYNSEPFTHTGVLLNRQFGELDVYAGWTLGWDTGFDQFGNGNSWLGGFSYQLGEFVSLAHFSTAGDFGQRGQDGYSHSVVFDLQLTDDWNYVLQSDYLRVNGTGEDNVGINQYAFYSLSDRLAIGTRMEWWKGDVLTGYAPHGGVLPAAGSLSYYAATVGLNVRPTDSLVVRPELRHDWSSAANYEQTYFGVDAIWTF